MNELAVLREIARCCRTIFGEKLTGVYVHGSLAFGCFRREISDIDFLVVTREAPEQPEKTALLRSLLALEADAPAKGLEMSVVREEDCRHFVYPTPFSLHYSHCHKTKCIEDIESYCRDMHGSDWDLAAHFTVTQAVGIPLCGKDIPSVFGPVPREAYIDSICRDVREAADRIVGNPISVVLNLCRVLACIREPVVLSKEQGGEWGLAHLPAFCVPVAAALDCYRAGTPAAVSVTEGQLRAFAAYMTAQIWPDSAGCPCGGRMNGME